MWTPATGGTAYTLNGRNEVTAINSASVTYDANQNATSITGNAYGYDAANRLTSATPSGGSAASFVFDPLSRLSSSTVSSTTTRYQYAGVQLAAEYDASGAVTRRYVPGLGLDGVAVAYTGAGVTTRDWLLADERGSVVALTGSTGVVSTINRYDEYGTPHSSNAGRFGYTGQAWMAEAAAWHYRARAYLPGAGRFLQTDPIGYAAGANLYAYVGADPVNWVDPFGFHRVCIKVGQTGEVDSNGDITVTPIVWCYDLDYVLEWLDYSSNSWTNLQIGLDNFFAGECSKFRPQSASPANDPTANLRDSMAHMSSMTARLQAGDGGGMIADQWAKGLNNINNAVQTVGFLGTAIEDVQAGSSLFVVGAGFAGRAGSTYGVSAGTQAAVTAAASAAGPEIGVPAGAVAGSIAGAAWVASGAAEASGGLAEDGALALMGCN